MGARSPYVKARHGKLEEGAAEAICPRVGAKTKESVSSVGVEWWCETVCRPTKSH